MCVLGGCIVEIAKAYNLTNVCVKMDITDKFNYDM